MLLSSEHDQVARRVGFGRKHAEAGRLYRAHRQRKVEHMLVKPAVGSVVSEVHRQRLTAAVLGAQRHVVKRKSFREMCHVVLAGDTLEILDQVGERSDRTIAVEGRGAVWKGENKVPARLDDSAPLMQAAKRIGAVLEHVAGSDEIVGRIWHRDLPRLGDELPADSISKMEGSAFVDVPFPNCLWTEVAAIKRADDGIKRDLATRLEHRARSADFDSMLAGERLDCGPALSSRRHDLRVHATCEISRSAGGEPKHSIHERLHGAKFSALRNVLNNWATA